MLTSSQIVEKHRVKGLTLKADVANELKGMPIPADYYIEIDEKKCEEARDRGFNVIHGDLRAMPFEDNYFNNIIDISTTDHIDEWKLVLKEYKRVLKPNGRLITYQWFGAKPHGLNYNEFKEELKGLKILDEGEGSKRLERKMVFFIVTKE